MPEELSILQAGQPNRIRIKITLNRETNRLQVSPATVHLDLANQQEIEWRSEVTEGGSVGIFFQTGSGDQIVRDTPFRRAFLRCPAPGRGTSGPPLRNKARKEPYRYTVRLLDRNRQSLAVGEATAEVYVE